MINYKAPIRFIINILRKRNHRLKSVGVVLFDKEKAPFFTQTFRYVYIKIRSNAAHKTNLYWHANNHLYETDAFYTQKGTAIYEFDLSLIKARIHGQTNAISYFQHGRIKNLGISSVGGITVKWSEFSSEKLTFKKDKAPVIQITGHTSIIHLELTRRCNLKCYMCRENREEELKEIGMIDLPTDVFYKMMPFMRNASHLALFGWGEPLCHPDFKEFIKAIGGIKEKNSLDPRITKGPYVKPFTNFTTNGYLMNEDLIHSIIKSRIDEIVFSIDSPNADNYNFIRKGSDFNRVIGNLRKVQELKIKHNVKSPAVTTEFVAMRRNIEELPDMVKLTADLNVKRMIVTSIVVSTKGLEQESLFYHQKLTNEMFDKAENIAKENDIELILPDRFGTKSDPQGFCNDPHDIFYVRAEGTVTPCCVATNAVMGDLNKDGPKDIWMNERRNDFMDNLRKGTPTGECKTCYKFTGNDINLRSTHIKI